MAQNKQPEFDSQAAIRELAEATLPDGSVPFVSLWVECEHCNGTGNDYQPVQPYGSEHIDCHWCEGYSWRPEPDVEKACWRVFWLLSEDVRLAIVHSPHIDGWIQDGMVRNQTLAVAKMWLAEQRRLQA